MRIKPPICNITLSTLVTLTLVFTLMHVALPAARNRPKATTRTEHQPPFLSPDNALAFYSSCSFPNSYRPLPDVNRKEHSLSQLTARFSRCHVVDPLEKVNLFELGKRIRCYVNMTRSIAQLQTRNVSTDTVAKLRNLLLNAERVLFPFVRGYHTDSVQQWTQHYSGRGIVIATSSRFARYTTFLVKNLRLLGCKLPIEIFYIGEKDLRRDHQRRFSSMGLKVVDLTDLIDNSEVQAAGFAVKPFALFASSFQEVILLDADTVFLQNPELLFNDAGYQDTGALFFLDQGGGVGYHRAWFEDNVPLPHSRKMRDLPIYNDRVFDQMESSVVVMNKARAILGLLATCRLNMRKEREAELYLEFFGDKETWWIGFEIAQVDYAFHRLAPGAIGELTGRDAKTLCGKLAHLGDNGRPFWWNQGIVNVKFAEVPDDSVPKYQVFSRNGVWIACMNGTDPVRLNSQELKTISQLRRLWIETTGFDEW